MKKLVTGTMFDRTEATNSTKDFVTLLLYIINCIGCLEKYIGKTFRQLKERLIISRHYIQQEHQQIKVEKLVNIYRKGEVKVFPFKVTLYSNLLRESSDDHL